MADLKSFVDNVIDKFAFVSDATLIAGADNEKIAVAREVIIRSSECIGALFRPDVAEITLPGIDGRTLKSLIGFIYSGYIDINDENIEKLLQAAVAWRFPLIREKCVNFLREQLSSATCVRTLQLAEKLKLNKLRTQAVQLLVECVDKIPKNDLLGLSKSHFGELIKSNEFCVPETSIFLILVEWIDHKIAQRGKYMVEFLPFIRLDLLPGPFLFTKAKPVFEKHGLTRLIQEECERSRLEIGPVCQMRCPDSASQTVPADADSTSENLGGRGETIVDIHLN